MKELSFLFKSVSDWVKNTSDIRLLAFVLIFFSVVLAVIFLRLRRQPLKPAQRIISSVEEDIVLSENNFSKNKRNLSVKLDWENTPSAKKSPSKKS